MKKLIFVVLIMFALTNCEKADCVDCVTNYYNDKGYVWMANYVSLCDFTEAEINEYIIKNTSDKSITKCKR
jgi:transcription initiation factor IIE alpha subunit